MTKAKVEAEDAQRILLGALNGIAALLSADGKVAEAISAYRQARHPRGLLQGSDMPLLPHPLLLCSVGRSERAYPSILLTKAAAHKCTIWLPPARFQLLVPSMPMYAQVLATAAENAALVRADPLQRMHTLHNLAELLTAGGAPPPGVARTLRDDKLADEAGAISQVSLLIANVSTILL